MSAVDNLTASEVPFSSTVGKSVMFTAPGGAVVAQIAIMVPSVAHDYRETAEAVAARIIAAWNSRQTASADLMICDGCGCTTTDAELAAMREGRKSLISCCPERKMRPATREDWDKMRKDRAACSCDNESYADPVSSSSAPVSARTVKPLVWSTKCHDLEEYDPAKTYATGLGGRYCVDSTGPGVLLWDAADGFSWTQHGSVKEAKAAAQADYTARILSAIEAPVSAWQGIDSAPKDRTRLVVAVPDQHRTEWIVGEAYYDPETQDWYWAGTGPHGLDCGPISEANHWLPELWQPLQEPPAPPSDAKGV